MSFAIKENLAQRFDLFGVNDLQEWEQLIASVDSSSSIHNTSSSSEQMLEQAIMRELNIDNTFCYFDNDKLMQDEDAVISIFIKKVLENKRDDFQLDEINEGLFDEVNQDSEKAIDQIVDNTIKSESNVEISKPKPLPSKEIRRRFGKKEDWGRPSFLSPSITEFSNFLSLT